MIKINNKTIFSYKNSPIIIAELSGNHDGSKSKFLKLVKSACVNGADLIKIQTYEPKDITLNKSYGKFKIKSGIWKGKKLWNLYKKACTPFAWHEEAFKIAKKYKKIIFSSPFSLRGVDLLEKLGCKLYKIASFEITDLKLIKYIASKKKPIIISTGMATNDEIFKAIKTIEQFHSNIIILHCVSSYPTKLKDINLDRIKILKRKYSKYLIGLSDHTDNIYSSIAATTYNIVAIEKHFKLNNKEKTPDSSFSITPNQLQQLKKISREIFDSKNKKNETVQKKNKALRRSIFATCDIKKGDKITKNNIDTLRPHIGICASEFFKIINKKSNKNFKKGDPIFKKNIS